MSEYVCDKMTWQRDKSIVQMKHDRMWIKTVENDENDQDRDDQRGGAAKTFGLSRGRGGWEEGGNTTPQYLQYFFMWH